MLTFVIFFLCAGSALCACGHETVYRAYEVYSTQNLDASYVQGQAAQTAQNQVNDLLQSSVEDGLKAGAEYLTSKSPSKTPVLKNGVQMYKYTGTAPVNYKGIVGKFAVGAVLQIFLNQGMNLVGESASASTSTITTEKCPTTVPTCTSAAGMCTTVFCTCQTGYQVKTGLTTSNQVCYSCQAVCPIGPTCSFDLTCGCPSYQVLLKGQTSSGTPCYSCQDPCTTATGQCTYSLSNPSNPDLYNLCGCFDGFYKNTDWHTIPTNYPCARCDDAITRGNAISTTTTTTRTTTTQKPSSLKSKASLTTPAMAFVALLGLLVVLLF